MEDKNGIGHANRYEFILALSRFDCLKIGSDAVEARCHGAEFLPEALV